MTISKLYNGFAGVHTFLNITSISSFESRNTAQVVNAIGARFYGKFARYKRRSDPGPILLWGPARLKVGSS